MPDRPRQAVVLTLVAIALVGAVAATATAVSATPATADPSSQLEADHVQDCAAEPPPDDGDPNGSTDDVIGWVDGYWYDEPLDIDRDELSTADVEELALRTAARIEAMRCLTFEASPPFEFLTREEYRDDVEAAFANVSTREWDAESARLATLQYAGQSTDVEELTIDVNTAFPTAFYDTEDGTMGFIVNDPDDVDLDETTLAHELTHALDDQQFNLTRIFDRETNDALVAGLAVAEGGATLLEERYGDSCDPQGWADPCVSHDQMASDPPHWGLALDRLAAYHMPLVASTHADDGWAGVDALYTDLPTSTLETIHPERYGTYDRPDLAVPDESADGWERITVDGEIAVDTIGQHGLTAMLMAPAYESNGQVEIGSVTDFTSPHIGGDLSFDIPRTSGYRGDEVYSYITDANETGSVWTIAWADGAEADAFLGAYQRLLRYNGADAADGFANVFTFEGEPAYDMAVALERDADRLTIVTAPTIDDLEAVHAPISLEASATPTPTTTPDPTPTPVTTPTPSPTPEPDATPTPEGNPGPGLAGAILSIMGIGYALRRWSLARKGLNDDDRSDRPPEP